MELSSVRFIEMFENYQTHCALHFKRSKLLRLIIVHDAQREVMEQQSKDVALYLSSAALKAAHEAASMTGKALLQKDTAIAVEATSRTADRTHGWTAARQQPAVQIANVVLPTPEERAKLDALDAKLDEIVQTLDFPLAPLMR